MDQPNKVTLAADGPLHEQSAVLTKAFIAMTALYPIQVVATACLTAAATMFLGRPLRVTDKEAQEAATVFMRRILDLRDVLREDATWMADQPDKVM